MPGLNKSEIGANPVRVVDNPNCPPLPNMVTFRCPLNPTREIEATLVSYQFDTPNKGVYSVKCECDAQLPKPNINIEDQSKKDKTIALIVSTIFVENIETNCGHPTSHLN